ncbi:MAG UNVERIFIED_CONTAM: hypothetical protein LVR29_03395 [Microcystis novacekii LVE1205-3]|jgi:hypothetical protein
MTISIINALEFALKSSVESGMMPTRCRYFFSTAINLFHDIGLGAFV